MYLYNTALGKAILSEMSEDAMRAIIERHGLHETTERTISDGDELFDELERVRDRGFAFDDEERLKGLLCVAAPIIDNSGNVAGAVSVSGPTSRMDGEWFTDEIPEKLHDVVNVLSLNLTYS